MRIANAKYREQGTVETYGEGLQMLIDECIQEQYDWRPWQEFRDQEMYNLEVNDLLHANMKGIQKLMSHNITPNQKYFKMNDC